MARAASRSARPTAASRWMFVLVVALYVLAIPYHPGLRSPNELCRLWQTRALVDFKTLSLNQAIRAYGPVGDLSRFEGKLYPSKAPLLSFAAVPIYKALSVLRGGSANVNEVELVVWSRFFLTVLPTLALLLLLWRFLSAYLSRPLVDGLVGTYALGTLAFSYSLLFMSHQATAVLLFCGFYALWRCGRGDWGPGGYLTAGACAGAALAAEYTSALGIVALAFYGLLLHLDESPEGRWSGLLKSAGLAALGALPFVAALLLYHWRVFGHPLHTGYLHLNDAAYQPWHLGGFLGIRTPDTRAFLLSFFSPLRGFFTLSPFLALAFFGFAGLWRDPSSRPQVLFVVLLTAMYAYFTSSFSYDSWGWTTGPRHLTGWVPFLLLPVGMTFRALEGKPLLQGIAAGLCLVSMLVTGMLTGVNYIPDSVTSPVFGFAAILYKSGFTPPTWLARVLPNPRAGGIWLGMLVLAALLTTGRFVPWKNPRKVWVPALVTCVLYLGMLALLPRSSKADEGAVGHLESVWLIRPGQYLPRWR
jgi:hypothetical protein